MKLPLLIVSLLCSITAYGQTQLFKDCNVKGSTTIYDGFQQKWIFSDSADAKTTSLPASTFKVINLLIALQTGVIKNENEVVKWPGYTDTTLYGYRPEIYRDMTVKEAFEVSAGWVFIELAKRIGRIKYLQYLKNCHYGNMQLSEKGDDFWNFGEFGISPVNQVTFLIAVYYGKVPFSRRNLEILKKVMITDKTPSHIIRSKTGWTRTNGIDLGWWVGYVEYQHHPYFFATRITKDRQTVNPRFGQCRKDITLNILKQLKYID
jgi:beta-lactamase class D